MARSYPRFGLFLASGVDPYPPQISVCMSRLDLTYYSKISFTVPRTDAFPCHIEVAAAG